ncbi:S-adenosyl-L-methionine-dependent methyltransferase [Tribonema minus]|uniref:Cytosine-specific methyltransferase n=1 Tax=Tribonema minus TaxID=303371 RepID=A0A836CGP1_9STRA|nr:S-adenosyl-L-methionine-dependent methyltransferase [Tribonema minus]
MYNSLDVFSGIGGLSLALSGYATPVAFCEIDTPCRDTLTALMSKGNLPKVPLLRDVRKLKRDCVGCDVDLITAGFPCVGLSAAGLHQGFENPQSALFFELARVIGEFRPAFLVLENVTEVVGHLGVVHRTLNELGYDIKWCVLSAAAVGAPHLRKRWFCLGERRGDPKVSCKAAQPAGPVAPLPPWNPDDSRVGRMAPDSANARDRMAMLGNSVVPKCARHAFEHLWRLSQPEGRQVTGEAYPHSGYTAGSEVYAMEPLAAPCPAPPMRLALDPSTYAARGQGNMAMVKHRILTSPCSRTLWTTPRHGMLRACHVLTTRTARDLPTQIRFERNTTGDRGGQVDASFVEQMMGYPAGWTEH